MVPQFFLQKECCTSSLHTEDIPEHTDAFQQETVVELEECCLWPQITGVFTQATASPTHSSEGTWARHMALKHEANDGMTSVGSTTLQSDMMSSALGQYRFTADLGRLH